MWGFTANQPRKVDLDNADMTLANKIMQREPSIAMCISCGSCSATCTASNLTDFNFRKLHNSLKRGEYRELGQIAKKCMLCGKCKIVCPRGVNTRNIIVAIRRELSNQ